MTQPAHRPERQQFQIHVGGAESPSVLPEWWGGIDSEIESRQLRFWDDTNNWLEATELPAAVTAAGGRFAEVVGVDGLGGLDSPTLDVGRRVLLQPNPNDPRGPNAIAVWLEDGSAQVGYLPSDVAAETMSEASRLGKGFGAFVASEQRDAKTQARRGLMIILGPGVVWAKETA